MSVNRPGPFLIVAAVVVALFAAGGAAYWVLLEPSSPPAAEPVRPASPATEAPVAEDPQRAARVILIECRQGACQWGRIVEIARVAAGEDGELRRMTFRPGSSMDDGAEPADGGLPTIDWEASDRNDYAYCSTRRPAFAFPDDQAGLIVHHLDLFDLGGYQYASAKLYGLICHDLPMEAAVGQAFRDLGYRPGTRNEQTRALAPQALLRR
jgi:hypothetical protein